MNICTVIKTVLLTWIIGQEAHTSPIMLNRSFHHQNKGGIESLVFYLSGHCIPRMVSDQTISPTRKIRTYTLAQVESDAQVSAKFPCTSQLGYSVHLKCAEYSTEFSITYNPQRVMIVVGTCYAIRNQYALVLHAIPRVAKQEKKKNGMHAPHRVVIDCGHGGLDTGAIGAAGIQEKQVTLMVGNLLEDYLKREGVDVMMTRTRDVDMPLDARTSKANRYAPDLFVSLHANYAQNQHASGIETWFLSTHIQSLIGHSDTDGAALLHNYLLDRVSRSGVAARQIHRSLITSINQSKGAVTDRGVKQAVSQVLLGVDAPAILIELGFVSNHQEEQLLNSKLYQKQLARGICTGIMNYLSWLDFNSK